MEKSLRVIATSAAFLFLGLTVPANSRQEQQDKPRDNEGKQQQHNTRQDQKNVHQQHESSSTRQGKPQGNRPEDRKPREQQQQSKKTQDQGRQQPQQRELRSGKQRSPEEAHQQQAAWQDNRAHDWKSDHRTWQQRGGYNGYRVTDDRFRAYYGQNHGFRIFSLPVMFVGGNRRFQFGGYWFGLVDPWPEYWANDWYDSDDVWVDDYAGGYYLCNRNHPGDRIAISFYLD